MGLIFVDPQLYAKEIIIAIAFVIFFLCLNYLIPESLSKYNLVGIYLSFAILPWLGWIQMNIRRQYLGELLFVSQHLPLRIYYLIPLASIALWLMRRILQSFAGKTISSTIDIGGVEINSYLWSGCISIAMLSIMIYGCVFFGFGKL